MLRCGYDGNHLHVHSIMTSGLNTDFITYGISNDGYITLTANVTVTNTTFIVAKG